MKNYVFIALFLLADLSVGCSAIKVTPTNGVESEAMEEQVFSNTSYDDVGSVLEEDVLLKEDGYNEFVDGEDQTASLEENKYADDMPATKLDVTNEAIDPQGDLDTALQLYEEAQKFWIDDKPEKAIAALDDAYQNILNVNSDDVPELEQQVENLRFMISKRILEIYASRYIRAKGINKEIPLILNSYVEKEIKLFQGRERDFFLDSYQRSGHYRDKILEALKEAGLPEELSWLPLIESGFKVRALSRARALGLWQFIPSTGYKFGLHRDSWVDERLDPEKSTQAAIAYLKELHQIFGDWVTVLAAYNCGEGRILRLIRNQKINYLDNFWDLYERLPRETARYVPRFMATLHILKDPEKYGFELKKPQMPAQFETVTVEKQMHLKSIAKFLGVDADLLTALNPDLRYNITPKASYELKIPEGAGERLLAGLADIPATSLPKAQYRIHYVRKGENLSIIAQKYRTSVWRIARANNIRKKHLIRVGQRLKIPVSKKTARTVRRSKATLSADGTYRVRRGDSLWSIARQFKTTMKEIKEINNLNSTRLYVNQVLKISSL